MKNLTFFCVCLLLSISCSAKTITVDDVVHGDKAVVAESTHTGADNKNLLFLDLISNSEQINIIDFHIDF